MPKSEIRLAKKEDMSLMFLLRNERDAIANSASKKDVKWGNHWRWFREAIKGTETILWIVKPDVGFVCAERRTRNATISIYLQRKARGMGLGVKAIKEAIDDICETWAIDRIFAKINEGNEISVKAFEKAGFKEIGLAKDVHRVFQWTNLKDTKTVSTSTGPPLVGSGGEMPPNTA